MPPPMAQKTQLSHPVPLSVFAALRIAVLALIAMPAVARAQVAASAVVGASSQGEGKSDSPYLGPAFGGGAAAVIGMIDAVVGSHVSVGGEVSVAGSISG